MVSKAFQNKLRSYSALAGSLALANSADGQIIYTDISPDSLVNLDGGYYQLDLNNDGLFDFEFTQTITAATGTSGSYNVNAVGISPLDSNAVAGSTAGAYVYPFAMNPGDTVQSTLTWNVGADQSMGSYFGSGYTYGNWPGLSDKYVGLKINVEGALYYGWARLDVAPVAESFTIKDYAYNSVENEMIIIGATSTGIGIHETLQGIKIHAHDNVIYINSDKEMKGLLSVKNTLGQEIHSAQLADQHYEITINNAKPGIYFATVISEGKTKTKKIILK